MSTKRKAHPKSRPLPGPMDDIPAFAAACGQMAEFTIGLAIANGKAPAQALLSAARVLIASAQQVNAEVVDCGGCAPPVITGGPRFTETR